MQRPFPNTWQATEKCISLKKKERNETPKNGLRRTICPPADKEGQDQFPYRAAGGLRRRRFGRYYGHLLERSRAARTCRLQCDAAELSSNYLLRADCLALSPSRKENPTAARKMNGEKGNLGAVGPARTQKEPQIDPSPNPEWQRLPSPSPRGNDPGFGAAAGVTTELTQPKSLGLHAAIGKRP